MKYTVFISLLIASAAGMPFIFRRDALIDAIAQFNSLSDGQQAEFLDQITKQGAVSVQGANSAGGAAGSGSGNDVVADVDATAIDDGEANVAITGSNDIQVKADVQALDDGVVNLNVQGQLLVLRNDNIFTSSSPLGRARFELRRVS